MCKITCRWTYCRSQDSRPRTVHSCCGRHRLGSLEYRMFLGRQNCSQTVSGCHMALQHTSVANYYYLGLVMINFILIVNFWKKIRSSTCYSAPLWARPTAEALRYMARTKQCRIYLPYTFPAVAGTHLPTRKDGGLSKPRPMVQRATGPRLLRDRLRPAQLEP